MAQQSLDSSGAPENFQMFTSQEIEVEGMKVGLKFLNENTAVEAVLRWGEKALYPLAKARRGKGLAETGGKRRGRRCLDCPHGRNRKGGARDARPKQALKFTKCPVTIVVNENEDGSWEITKTVLEHFGHAVSKRDYYLHEHTKRLNEDDKDYVKELLTAKANPNNIATCLNQKTGKLYSGQDVRNLIKKINDNETDNPKAEDILGKIQDAGGRVAYTKNSENFVDVLWIQTADMVHMLNKEKPRLFQNDTTFGKLILEEMFIYKNDYAFNTLACDDDNQAKALKMKMQIYLIYELITYSLI